MIDIVDWLDAQGTKEAHSVRDEIERLREDLAARDLVIKQMREGFRDWQTCDLDEAKCDYLLKLQPSTEALRDRDRKRDAALLDWIAKCFGYDDIATLAERRKSGEWEPEL